MGKRLFHGKVFYVKSPSLSSANAKGFNIKAQQISISFRLTSAEMPYCSSDRIFQASDT
jgi:hypothetical protein